MRIASSYRDDDGSPLEIFTGEHVFEFNEISVETSGVPFLVNTRTSEFLLPYKTAKMLTYFTDEAITAGHSAIRLQPRQLGKKRYSYCEDLRFLYSQIDYEYIPGLVRPWDDGFLTPVFFNIGVLNKYTQDPKYRLDLFSDTYGTIFAEDWVISFGINKSKKVIFWLGDIGSLPVVEQYYLRSENVESDHDIHSEFYDAQIDVQPSKRSNLSKTIHLRSELNGCYAKKFGSALYVFEGEISAVLLNLSRPVFWVDKHVAPAIESINRIFVESLNAQDIKSQISSLSPNRDTKSIGGIKSLQILLELISDSEKAARIMLPFFVLYDLRIYCCHLMSEDRRFSTITSVINRLKIDSKDNFEAIYDALLLALSNSLKEIIDIFER